MEKEKFHFLKKIVKGTKKKMIISILRESLQIYLVSIENETNARIHQ